MTSNTTTRRAPTTPTTTPELTSSPVRLLLRCGVLAGPLYVAIWLTQAVTREGFDFRRHAASVLANGDLGWLQVTNLITTGLLVVATAVGLRHHLLSGRGGTWAPLLLGGYGAGMLLAGIFPADPVDGFPVGTPSGPAQATWQGTLHFVFAGLAFLSLIAAMFVLARRFSTVGRPGWARYSLATGIIFLVSWLGVVATGATAAAFNIALSVAITLAWVWITALSLNLIRHTTAKQ